MECNKIQKVFKVVGMKSSGRFEEFGTEVPKTAQQFLTRRAEVEHALDVEVALFEPKRDENHVEGSYMVGLLVEQTPETTPLSMAYIEESREYVTTKGNMNEIGDLHQRLAKWSEDHGYIRDLESLIVETYHPLPNGEEEVTVYLPVI